jgi:hypothetical protein
MSMTTSVAMDQTKTVQPTLLSHATNASKGDLPKGWSERHKPSRREIGNRQHSHGAPGTGSAQGQRLGSLAGKQRVAPRLPPKRHPLSRLPFTALRTSRDLEPIRVHHLGPRLHERGHEHPA